MKGASTREMPQFVSASAGRLRGLQVMAKFAPLAFAPTTATVGSAAVRVVPPAVAVALNASVPAARPV